MEASWIKTDGTITAIVPGNGKYFTLKEMQHYVGGFIRFTLCRDAATTMAVNENGAFTRPANELATSLYLYGKHQPIWGDVIVGDHCFFESGGSKK